MTLVQVEELQAYWNEHPPLADLVEAYIRGFAGNISSGGSKPVSAEQLLQEIGLGSG